MKDDIEKRIERQPDDRSQRPALKDIPVREELLPRTVKTPDGQEIKIDPLQDYFCQAGPTVQTPAYTKIIEDLFNWARAESLWILGFIAIGMNLSEWRNELQEGAGIHQSPV